MKYFKENKGITIIALVITIIILLILAGITVATITGDNGIIKNAGKAKDIVEEKKIIDELESALLVSTVNGDVNYDFLNKNLKKINNLKYKNDYINEEDENKRINKLPVFVEINGYKFDILENGEIKIRPEYEKLRNMYGATLEGYDEGKSLEEKSRIEEWKLFYVDEENSEAFFISSNTLLAPQPTNTGIPNLSKYSGNNSLKNIEYSKKYNILWNQKYTTEDNAINKRATAYLCDRSNWSMYENNKVKYAVGGPTIEMFIASLYNMQIIDFKEASSLQYVTRLQNVTSLGYPKVLDNNTIPENTIYNNGYHYWLASPSNTQSADVRYIKYSDQRDSGSGYDSIYIGLRPLICVSAYAIEIDESNNIKIK